jgi:hypothetical protein
MCTYLLTELSPSWGAANCAATQELPSMLRNPKGHHRVHKSPQLVPILSQIDPVHTILSYLSKIYFNIVHHLHISTLHKIVLGWFTSRVVQDMYQEWLKRNGHNTSVGKVEGRRSLGAGRHKRDDNIRMKQNVRVWTRFRCFRIVHWPVLRRRNEPCASTNFLTRWSTVIFLKRAPWNPL